MSPRPPLARLLQEGRCKYRKKLCYAANVAGKIIFKSFTVRLDKLVFMVFNGGRCSTVIFHIFHSRMKDGEG